MKDEMAQQAKDIYSGIKKIFPSSRRSGSFSLGRTSSSSEFSAEALAAAAAHDGDAPVKKKERRPSFSFSGWKERRSSLSSKKKELTTPPSSPPPVVTTTTKPTALTRSTSTNSAPSSVTAARGLGHSVAVPTPKGDSAHLQPSGSTTAPTALSRSTSHPGHFPAGAAPLSSSSNGLKQVPASVPVRSSASLVAKQSERTSVSAQRDTRAVTSPPAAPVVRKSSLKQQPSVESTRSSRSQSIVPELPTKSQLTARAHRASYSGFLSRSSHTEPPVSAPSTSRSRTSSYNAVSSSSGAASVAKEPEKKRRTSFSFSSRHQKNKSAAATSAAATLVVDDVAMIVKKPHASTWDSDSDDDYEDTHRPTRGLDRRSVSMDFMEQNPTHLISKIWRKLPIQARLYSGRGSIDLDLQKDRNSFSRSSTAKQQAEKLGQSNYNKPPSPLPNANVFGDKHIYFSQHIAYFPSPTDGEYVALESYDDVLVRVCNFAAHDQRRTATKVQEFLERSMAFLHGTKTKHGNVVSISNEEIRMWRRLARHDWSLEDVTLVRDLPDKMQHAQKDSRSSSAATTESDSDSDDPFQRRAAGAVQSKTSAMPEDDEDEDDEDLSLPPGVDLHALLTVVNSCVNFGEYLFSFDELDELVRLEFLVEEDGWI